MEFLATEISLVLAPLGITTRKAKHLLFAPEASRTLAHLHHLLSMGVSRPTEDGYIDLSQSAQVFFVGSAFWSFLTVDHNFETPPIY
ncbi:MAG: hypothetical protein JW384_02647 [Nitrosomonadaceae bacterium]|nr:hypothetical protein [Nitrosomonadaceae bacterium]